MQTPGHHRDLGVEMDLQLYYQSKDGSLNDDPSKIGGFYTMLQYGVFFPLGGPGLPPRPGHERLRRGPLRGADREALPRHRLLTCEARYIAIRRDDPTSRARAASPHDGV
jgi:hypothetical protein